MNDICESVPTGDSMMAGTDSKGAAAVNGGHRMSTATFPQTMPAPLESFHRKLPTVLDGGSPPLSDAEQMWLAVFTRVAQRFSRLPRDESFGLSFHALWKCDAKGKGDLCHYLRRACINAHLNFLKRTMSKYPELRQDVADKRPRPSMAVHLDLVEVVAGMGEPHARVIRLLWAGYERDEMAEELGVSRRQAIRILRQAEALLRQRLGVSYVLDWPQRQGREGL